MYLLLLYTLACYLMLQRQFYKEKLSRFFTRAIYKFIVDIAINIEKFK